MDLKAEKNKNRIFFDPFSFIYYLSPHKNLLYQFSKREIVSRYRGSVLGLAWTVLQPIFMLCVYTFVFSVVFNAKWGNTHTGGKAEFALVLFVGIITFNIIGDTINAAPTIILSNVNLVKKVIFPLEILPVVGRGARPFFLSAMTSEPLQNFANRRFSWTAERCS